MSIRAFFKPKKCSKVRSHFSAKKRYICPDQVALTRLWPRFCTPKIAANIYKTKFEDIKPNVRKSKKGGSVKADFFFQKRKYQKGQKEKKSNLVILVILCLPVSNMTINESKESERRILYFVTGKYIWNIWTLIKWDAQLKNISEIFGGR